MSNARRRLVRKLFAQEIREAASSPPPIPHSLHVLTLENNTMGHHGSPPDWEERAAENPWAGPHDVFEFHVLNEHPGLEQLLLGQPAFIFVNDGGSYHERWLYVEVYVQVADEMLISEQWENLPVFSHQPERRFKQAWAGPFRGMRDIIQRLQEMGNHRITPTGTSEQYWQDQVRRHQVPDRRRLNPLTGEYEVGHEGD